VDGLVLGKTAVITGAAQGIGLEIARLLHRHGANVVVADLDADRSRDAAAQLATEGEWELGTQGPATLGLQCDVTDQASMESAVRSAVDTFGGLDIFVNNAGIARDASLRNMTVDDFMGVINVHLRGSWLGVQAAATIMREAGSGSIINMSSLSGKSGNAGQTNYSAAKAGIVGLTKAAAKELASKNVRVNAVQPGLIRTPMTAGLREDVFAAREADIPMKRAGEPHEVAGAVLFLASDLASYVTGATLEVGGGRLM
jgi:3-oxoacyl-[acyl-carrier protein] reductase